MQHFWKKKNVQKTKFKNKIKRVVYFEIKKFVVICINLIMFILLKNKSKEPFFDDSQNASDDHDEFSKNQ